MYIITPFFESEPVAFYLFARFLRSFCKRWIRKINFTRHHAPGIRKLHNLHIYCDCLSEIDVIYDIKEESADRF